MFVTSNVRKSVMLPESVNDFMLLTLCDDGVLLLWSNAAEEWKRINNKHDEEFRYDDIAVYRGRFVVIDRWGTVSLVDSPSLQLIK